MTEIKNTYWLFNRANKVSLRGGEVIFSMFVLPIIFLVLFVYVMGSLDSGSLGGISQVNFILPGVLIMTVSNATAMVAASVNTDMQKGMMDRLLSMPLSKFSILNAQVISAVSRSLISTAFVMLIAWPMGFAPTATFVGWLILIGIVVLYTIAVTWFAVLVGLLVKSVEATAMFGAMMQVLVFISSAFVAPETMAPFFQGFATYQPISVVIDNIRSILVFGEVSSNWWVALIWLAGLIVVGMILSLLVFIKKRK